MKISITSHTIVRNEENYIKPALLSIIDKVSQALVWDTGSIDKTINTIKSINNPKINFREFKKIDREKIVKLRNLQIKNTKTEWFLILDGDEIWPEHNLDILIEAANKSNNNIIALVNKSRNCIGDIYHYLPDKKGKYCIGEWKGHLNIRLIRNLPGLKVIGRYPNESYTYNSIPIQKFTKRLKFVDTWYLHTTHLKRSSLLGQINTIDRLKKYKLIGKGIKLLPEEIPQILVK